MIICDYYYCYYNNDHDTDCDAGPINYMSFNPTGFATRPLALHSPLGQGTVEAPGVAQGPLWN